MQFIIIYLIFLNWFLFYFFILFYLLQFIYCYDVSGAGADMFPGGGCGVWSGGAHVRAGVHQEQRHWDPQGHPALGHGGGLQTLRQNGACRPQPQLLCGQPLHPSQAWGALKIIFNKKKKKYYFFLNLINIFESFYPHFFYSHFFNYFFFILFYYFLF